MLKEVLKKFWPGSLTILAIFCVLLIFTRFFNLEYTARFTEDESGFLVRVHQIYEEKKLTLVGQVNDQGTKVFSSSTVYLLLPFAILGNFDPASVFGGAAVWGVVTILVMVYLFRLIGKKPGWAVLLLLLFWFPLLQTGRWAWNPNFIPLFISLAIIFYLKQKNWAYLVSGIFLGLSVHQHYYAIFAIAIFDAIVSLIALINKQFSRLILINLGIFIALSPFIIFDLRHPPGVFLLGASGQAGHFAIQNLVKNIFLYTWQTAKYHTQSSFLAVIFLLSSLTLLIKDIFSKSKSLVYFIPIIAQMVIISALAPYFIQYFFPIIVFVFCWLIFPRKGMGKWLANLAIATLILSGVIALPRFFSTSPVEPDLITVKAITRTINGEIVNNNLKNINIAALSSPDLNTYGKKYRDLLLVNYNIRPKTIAEYQITDNLFVVSKASESVLLKDPAAEISPFRSGIIKSHWQFGSWYLYLFNKQ